ncbi:hypothetical protein GCM10027567_17170 [Spongiibacter taiwanensis]
MQGYGDELFRWVAFPAFGHSPNKAHKKSRPEGRHITGWVSDYFWLITMDSGATAATEALGATLPVRLASVRKLRHT